MSASPTPADPPPLAQLLRFVPFFAALPGETQACFAVLKRGRVQEYAAGAGVTRRGDAPELVFVLSGRLASRDTPCDYRRGDHYGETDLLLGRAASADVIAAETSLVLRLEQGTFEDLIDSCRSLVRGLLRAFAERAAGAASPQSARGDVQ